MTAQDAGLVNRGGKLTATACAELVALDVLKAASAAVADDVPVDGRLVARAYRHAVGVVLPQAPEANCDRRS